MKPASSSDAYLQARLDVVEQRVRRLVALRRSTDPDPDDSFRGLYISDEQVDRMLAGEAPRAFPGPEWPEGVAELEAWADAAEQQKESLALRNLRRSFGLDLWETEFVLIALAPDLDPRFERLYGYLNDDVSRRRACIGLALELCGVGRGHPDMGPMLGRFHPAGRLVSGGLMLVEESERPLLTRPLRVPDRVIGHLLGDQRPEPDLAPYLAQFPAVRSPAVDRVRRAVASGARLIYVRESTRPTGLSVGASALSAEGLNPVALRLSLLDRPVDPSVVNAAAREAKLAGGGLVAGPIDRIADQAPGTIAACCDAGCPVILMGSRSWDPLWTSRVPVVVDAPNPTPDDNKAMWRGVLDGTGPAGNLLSGLGQFRLTAEQIQRAATFASQAAAAEGGEVTLEKLQAGARAQNAGALERLTRRIEPRAGWHDLVLPADLVVRLRELADRARLADRVVPVWNGASTRGVGVSALFAGDSGTGKTMSAEIVAHDLGLDLYVIDLSTVIDKYIGETEKNLERIFVEADRVNAVLLFDEADAIFGKRSEVQDAHDRYANVETAYLLQRMERFDGLAILTTNLRSNLDEAFTRRLDAIVDFPYPEEEYRRRLWEVHLSRGLSSLEGLDLDFLARSFRLSGGNISSVVLAAAFLAARDEVEIGMPQLILAIEREYRKLGNLCVPEEFGEYYGLISGRAPAPG